MSDSKRLFGNKIEFTKLCGMKMIQVDIIFLRNWKSNFIPQIKILQNSKL